MNIGTLSELTSSRMDRGEGFASYLEEIRLRVNDRIQEVVEGHLFDDHLLPLLLRGKRLRAGVLLLIHETLADDPGRTGPHALDLACALELAHAASLIVDDMIDEDIERRGLSTIHLSRGIKTAMLDSIGILSLPYALSAPYHGEYVSMLSEVQRSMTLGVLREMFSARSLPATAWYEAIITLKTGRLFGLASEWGFMIASDTKKIISPHLQEYESVRERWRTYGIHLGRSMQIADDIVDLQKRMAGEITGKSGSEMLLLEAVSADGLIENFFSDIRNHTPGSKIYSIKDSDRILRRLHQLLRIEEEQSECVWQSLEEIHRPWTHTSALPPRHHTLLRMLGRSIAEIMLEGAPAVKAPVITGKMPLKCSEIPVKE
jgi:geranylgeranyl pyrophosphate synthase